jgi:DNA-binding transcriptional ArsR family regulator
MSATAEKVEQLLLTNEEDIYLASRSLKAMAHPLRLKILCMLGQTSEASVQDIVDRMGTSQSNISQHLSVLRDENIVTTRKDANKVYYRIGDPKILNLIGSLREAFCSRCD